MEIFAMTDSVKVLGFAKFLLNRHDCSFNNNLSVLSDAAYEPSLITTGGALSISAAVSPIDSIAPPIVRSSSYRTVPRTLARKKYRTRKRSAAGDDGEEDGFFGDGDDGPFGGSSYGGVGGGGGGRGWNFDGFGGRNWEDDESSSSSFSDPAFDFVYEVISWIALSNCVHFAFKKVVRIVADGIGDASREKVPVRYVPVY